jgi:hypothetical protein
MRDATQEEARQIEAIERRAFGYSINPCQSIPPQHSPHVAGDGHTYCTRCGERISE